MTNPLRDSVNARIGHDTGDYADLIWRKAFPNNEKPREAGVAKNAPASNQ